MRQASYQVIIMGAGRSQHGALLASSIRARLDEIAPNLGQALVVLEPSDLAQLSGAMPAVGIYLGGDNTTDEGSVIQLHKLAVPVLPVVDDFQEYSEKVPQPLHAINGAKINWQSPDFSRVVNVVLENLSLLRRDRRLFISYLRKESTPIAHQLRVALDDEGYDTFLDTSSVPKGDEFQSVLWHRLLDSDVMLVLDTENFLLSRWTTEELAQAAAMSIGILRVIWPGVSRVREAELATPLYLDVSDFDASAPQNLTGRAVAKVLSAVESLRARNMAARHNNLVLEFCREAELVGASTSVLPERYVLAIAQNGRRIAAIPAVGVPDANRYHDASKRFPNDGKHADEAILLYDHRGMLSEWMSFLDWLDGFLPVKSLRVTDTASRFAQLKGGTTP